MPKGKPRRRPERKRRPAQRLCLSLRIFLTEPRLSIKKRKKRRRNAKRRRRRKRPIWTRRKRKKRQGRGWKDFWKKTGMPKRP